MKSFRRPYYLDEHGKKIKLARRTKRLNRSTGGTVVLFFFMALLAIFMGMPLVLTVSNALKPLDELFYFPPRFFVRNPTLSNFGDLFVLMQESWIPFSRYIVNTLILTVFGTAGHLLCASAAAYPLAKDDIPGKNWIFAVVVLSLMFAGTVTAIPNFIIISALGINNTYWAIILPAFSASLGLYLMKQFMEQIPDSLIESARIDGASEYKIYWKIVMPNVKPAWITLIIFAFTAAWQITGFSYIFNEALKPLPTVLEQIRLSGIARMGVGAAASVFIMTPPMLMFIFCQSNVIETMAHSGLKE